MNKKIKALIIIIILLIIMIPISIKIIGTKEIDKKENQKQITKENQNKKEIKQQKAENPSPTSEPEKVLGNKKEETKKENNTTPKEIDKKNNSTTKETIKSKDDKVLKPTTSPTPTQPPKPTTPHQTPTPTPQPVKTQKDINNETLETLKNKYNINILIRENSKTNVGYNRGIQLTDETRIATVLKELDNLLSRFPSGFFSEVKAFGINLTLNLLDSISNGMYGQSNSEYISDIVVSVATSSSLYEETLFHELMHYIDTYLEVKMYPDTPETEYAKCNPEGYTYGSARQELNFTYQTASTAYFVAGYGQNNYKEDRATLFPRMMRPYTGAAAAFLNYSNSPLTCKARVIKDQLDRYFNTVTPTTVEYWERLVK